MEKQITKTFWASALVLLMMIPGLTVAQVETSLNPGVDVMSRYIWRGINLGGSSPSIQPSLEFTAGNFTLGSWGAFSTSNGLGLQETDLYLSYTFRDVVSLTVTDFFFPNDTVGNNHYFEFDANNTGHLMEASAMFNGTDKIPFTFMAALNFWGADALKADGKKQYSTYFELGYNGTCKEVDYNVFLGFTPNNPDEEKGETGYYGPDAGIINLGIKASKSLKINDNFSLPISTSLIVNPVVENVFLVVGISL